MQSELEMDVAPEAPRSLNSSMNTCAFCGRETVEPCRTVNPDMLNRAKDDHVCRETLRRIGGGESFPNPSSATVH